MLWLSFRCDSEAEKRIREDDGAVERDEGSAEVAACEARPCPPREKEATEQGGCQALLLQEDDTERASFVSMEMRLPDRKTIQKTLPWR